MKIKNGFVLRDVCGVQVIVGEGLDALDFGKLLSLNDTGAFLWKSAVAQGNFTVDSLTDSLCEEYEVDAAKAKADVAKMVDEWQKVGVLE